MSKRTNDKVVDDVIDVLPKGTACIVFFDHQILAAIPDQGDDSEVDWEGPVGQAFLTMMLWGEPDEFGDLIERAKKRAISMKEGA